MRHVVFSALFSVLLLITYGRPAFAAADKLVAHDRYLLENSNMILTATIIDERTLRDVKIEAPPSHLGINTLSIPEITLRPAQIGGVEVLASAIDLGKFTLDVNRKSVDTDYNVVLKMGTRWLDALSRGGPAGAQLYFYHHEAGGIISTFTPNLYLQLQQVEDASRTIVPNKSASRCSALFSNP